MIDTLLLDGDQNADLSHRKIQFQWMKVYIFEHILKTIKKKNISDVKITTHIKCFEACVPNFSDTILLHVGRCCFVMIIDPNHCVII